MSIRRRPKLGARAPLSILLGNVPDAVDYVFEPTDGEGHKQLSALGVEREESNEHHLQAALSHTNVIHTHDTRPPSPSFSRAAAKPSTQPLPAYFIPTPDANGQAEDYDSLLPPDWKHWEDPSGLIKFSEKVEEVCGGWGGLGYEMDDADLAWLSAFNGKEEGGSGGSGTKGKDKDLTKASTTGSSSTPSVSSSSSLRIPEDVFEYIMGMLELWTEKNVPMLHTDLSLLPPLNTIEPVFRTTPPASYFPSFERPRGLPSPASLMKMVTRVYPHWKSRKEQRKGRSIIPQLNYDEAEESDPYLCFRRRDLKVQRKTRVKDITPLNRLEQVQSELTSATFLVEMVLMREKEKKKCLKAEREVWEARWGLVDLKRKSHPAGSVSTGPTLTVEEEALVFPHRDRAGAGGVNGTGATVVKRQRGVERDDAATSGRSTIVASSSSSSTLGLTPAQQVLQQQQHQTQLQQQQQQQQQKGLRSRAVSPTVEKVPPEQLASLIAEKVDKEMKRKRELDRHAEEVAMGVTFQPLPQPAPLRYFRCLPASASALAEVRAGHRSSLSRGGLGLESAGDVGAAALNDDEVGSLVDGGKREMGEGGEGSMPDDKDNLVMASSTLKEPGHPVRPPNHQICFRLRRGRGGIMRLDRKMPTVRHTARSQQLPTGVVAPGDPFMKLFPANPLAEKRVFESDNSDTSEEEDEDDAMEGVELKDRVAARKAKWEAQEEERARSLSERWRYDYDGGLVGIGMGVKDEDQVIIDDYETRFIKSRASLIKQEDLDLMMPSLAVIDRVRTLLAQPEEKPAPINFTRTVPAQLPPSVQGLPNPQAMQVPFQQQQADLQAQLYQHQREAQQLLQQHAQAQQVAQAQALQHGQTGQIGNNGTPALTQQQLQAAAARRLHAVAQTNPQLAAALAASGGQPIQMPQVRRIASGNVNQMGPPQATGSPVNGNQNLPQGTFQGAGRQVPQSPSPAMLNAMLAAQRNQQAGQGQIAQPIQQNGQMQIDQLQGTPVNGSIPIPNGHHAQSASPISTASQIHQSPRQPMSQPGGATVPLPNGTLPQNVPPDFQQQQQRLAQMKQNQMMRQQQAQQQQPQQNGPGHNGQPNTPAMTNSNGQMNLQLPAHRVNQMMAATQANGNNGVQGQMRAGGSPINTNNSPQMATAPTTMSVGGPGH